MDQFILHCFKHWKQATSKSNLLRSKWSYKKKWPNKQTKKWKLCKCFFSPFLFRFQQQQQQQQGNINKMDVKQTTTIFHLFFLFFLDGNYPVNLIGGQSICRHYNIRRQIDQLVKSITFWIIYSGWNFGKHKKHWIFFLFYQSDLLSSSLLLLLWKIMCYI